MLSKLRIVFVPLKMRRFSTGEPPPYKLSKPLLLLTYACLVSAIAAGPIVYAKVNAYQKEKIGKL